MTENYAESLRRLGWERSDIDLAIMGKRCTPELAINLSTMLNEKQPIPYFVDVVDYASLNQIQLKEHIDRVGKVFYIH